MTFKRPSILLIILALLVVLNDSCLLAARQPRINLGTLVPQGSTYHKSLLAMREKWAQAPEGGVRLVIYPDGTQGGEADMVRLMRIGMLQAGLLSAVGLSEIEPDITALQNMPMVFRNLKEYDYVSKKLRPKLEKQLEQKGFVVLFWMDAGWVRFFSKSPMLYPDDLRKLKLFVWAGDASGSDVLRKHRFKPVELETTEIISGMQTGLIDAVAAPPIFALATQLDRISPHMLELNYAPIMGAAVVKKDAWQKVPLNTRIELLKAAHNAGTEIKSNGRKEAREAVSAMQHRGLTVHSVTSEIEEAWIETAEAAYPDIRGNVVPADIFDEVIAILQEYRATQGEIE